MREYIVLHQEKWWHFFIKPFYGLCLRKKEGARFLPFEVLLPTACEDFCAIEAGNRIHLVCQEENGSILYLTQEEDTWHKVVLFENKSGTAYKKYFSMVAVGNFINLFYVITYQEKHMLVHQILTGEDRPPTVVDRVQRESLPYSVTMHTGTDITILYENESGKGGERLYRWSQKAFSRFMPVYPSAKCQPCCFLPEKDGTVRYAGFQKVEGIYNLVYFEKQTDMAYSEPTVVYLDCRQDAEPIFCRDNRKLYLVWQEGGSIMSSYLMHEEGKWSKPIRYMQPSGTKVIQYGICQNGTLRYVYGYEKGQDIVLYADEGLTVPSPQKQELQFKPEGYEGVEFASAYGGTAEEERVESSSPMTNHFRKELEKIKEQILDFKIRLTNLTQRLEAMEAEQEQKKRMLPETKTVPLAEETTIDTVLLRDAGVSVVDKGQEKHS